MKQIPAIGKRVRYQRKTSEHLAERTCTGTVVAQYRGGDRNIDSETGEEYTTPDHVAVKVDEPLPTWWPYNGTNRFAPEVSELEPL